MPVALFGQTWSPSQKAFDEMALPTGGLRPGWERVIPSLSALPQTQVPRMREQILRLLQQNGTIFNIDPDSAGHVRPWDLDFIPNVLPEEEWKVLQRGLDQRATLLNLVLADLYGPMMLVEKGLIPSELVHGFPGYLRACHGIPVAANRYLHFYAADLGRSADGGFWILGDRVQAPVGAGYALENRIVISRVLQNVFQSCHVHRLAWTFRWLREHLSQISLTHKEKPFIVLLTAGPDSPNYFEHAYLARYLGFTLVFGEDLSFRDNRIYLKTLSGLQPVDVLFRFVEDALCDPLELEGGSFQGVTGLLQALRARNVVVANMPGAGVVENPALMAFLGPLCEHLLGEALCIPSVPTWWCGREAQRKYVLEHFDDLVIKPSLPTRGITSFYPGQMAASDREDLCERMAKNPDLFVGQQRLDLSQAPVSTLRGIESRSVALRCFVAAHQNSYTVMPGGLSRVAASSSDPIVSDNYGGGCKDTWVISEQPVSVFSLLTTTPSGDAILRTSGGVVSRVADDLFWLGRYAERAQFQTRLLRSLLVHQFEESALGQEIVLSRLMDAVSGMMQPLAIPKDSPFSLLNLSVIIQDSSEKATLVGVLSSLYLAAHAVREGLSNDAWRVFLQIHEIVVQIREMEIPPVNPLIDLMDRLILVLAAFEGLAADGMSRGQGWRFLEMGRRLERVLQVTGLTRSMLLNYVPEESMVLETFLEILDSTITYRRRYHAHPEFVTAIDLVLCDERNPRSLAYQFVSLSEQVTHLQKDRDHTEISQEERLVLDGLTKVRLADIKGFQAGDSPGIRVSMDAFLSELERITNELVETLNTKYLVHSQLSQRPQRSNTQWTL